MEALRRRLYLTAATLTAAGLLASCMANPGPAPTVDPVSVSEPSISEEETETPTSTRTEVSVGVDALRNGLNPHLLADTSALVDDIAALVLPSAFVDGERNEDLLVSVEEVTPSETAVQTIRYEIEPEAQWSDGTPITAADFTYLCDAMTSTAGVIEPAGYRSISAIRATDGGRVVEVDFDTRIEDYTDLFSNLLPSHLADDGGADFSTAYYSTIGAGGGRYLIESVDRARGEIVLHRNDRFWGEDPAHIDILRLQTVSSVTQGVDLLRSGQVAFVDLTPSETMVEAFELLPGVLTTLVEGPRTLQLDLNVGSSVLGTADMRAQLVSLLDVELIARQAAGRSAYLTVPSIALPLAAATVPQTLIDATTTDPLRIGADPADSQAAAAVRTIADVLTGYGVSVEIVSVDIPTAASEDLPAGELDAVVSYQRTDGSRNQLASTYLCPGEVRTSNLSGYCAADADMLSEAVLTGAVSLEQAEQELAALNAREWVSVPLLQENRVVVLGSGIVGEDDTAAWTAGLRSAASWQLEEEQQ